MPQMFFYGTLQYYKRFNGVTGLSLAELKPQMAVVQHYAAMHIHGADYPMLVALRYAEAWGIVVDVPKSAVKFLDEFESVGTLYEKQKLPVVLALNPLRSPGTNIATTYMPTERLKSNLKMKFWNYRDWRMIQDDEENANASVAS